MQFNGVNLRGFADLAGKPKNPFKDKPLRLARKEYLQRQRNRNKRQAELKKRRTESVAEKLKQKSKKTVEEEEVAN